MLRCVQGLRQKPAPIPDGLFCMPNKLVVAVHCTDEPESFLWTDDDVGNRGFTDVGTVIGSGCDGLSVGDVVIVAPRSGKYVQNFRAGGWVYTCARFLGDDGVGGEAREYDPLMMVWATVDMDALKINPKGGRLLVKRDSYATSYGNLALPDTVGNRSGKAVVLEVDEGVPDVKVGDTVVCHAGSFDRASVPDELAKAYEADSKDLAFIGIGSVYAIVEP